MRTTKSPRRILEFAFFIGLLVLSLFSHKFNPKKFTQPQLFACWVFKEFMQLDYRKLAETLADAPDLRRLVELDRVPHFTTFHKASKRLLRLSRVWKMIAATVRAAQETGFLGRRVRLAALDGTGFESRHVSSYYVRRRAKGGKSWQNTEVAAWPLAKTNGQAPHAIPFFAALASGNRQLHAEAAVRFRASGAQLLESIPRNVTSGNHSEHHE